MLDKYGKYLPNINLKNYTSYRLEGHAIGIIYPDNLNSLKELIRYLNDNNIKYMVIGTGSNLIFKKDYEGILIKLDNFNELKIKDNIIEVEAGYNLIVLSLKTANLGLKGLEFASGLPASVGGAIYMNAGAYKNQMSDIIKEVTILDENLNIKVLQNKDLEFSYRHSIFQHKNWICLKVKLKLEHGKKEEILDIIKKRKERRILSQPLDYPSAGSVFRNPKDDYAGRLIEELGLKGTKIGGAMISEKHANFIINAGSVTGEDIVKLINLVKDKVKEKYNIDLKEEQIIIE